MANILKIISHQLLARMHWYFIYRPTSPLVNS